MKVVPYGIQKRQEDPALGNEPDYKELLQKVKALENEARERRGTEEALRESEIRLKTVLDTVQAGIVVIDPETHVIVGVNAAAGRMFGAPREQILNSVCHQCICPAPEGHCPVTNCGQAFENAEHVLLTHIGERVPILKTVVPVVLAGRQHLLESFVDITERKRAEEELRRINEELNNFVDMVSHDLKNPIMSIQGFCFLLLERYKEQLADRGRRYVDQIQTSVDQMQLLVSDLLELSRVGRVVSTMEEVSSADIVRKAAISLKGRLEAKGVELVVGDNLPKIYCDPGRMYQVIENLLINAEKFMGNTAPPRIEIGYKDVGDAHCFYVRDNGIGIDPRHHRKIFEMFCRLEEIGDAEGTGLGLAIVERVLKSHGGRIWVESQKGRGATFYFTLPKHPAVAETPRPSSESSKIF
jgi:PAS domain S-box-containing protein